MIKYDPQTRTVNLEPGETHITNWYINESCNVYETGVCNCGNNPPYFLGLSDCRHFTRDVLLTYDRVHDAPWWQFWRERR
ncbi:MAG: hypothetical protein KJN97_00030 [Deltaproteobacteria bacterium]|nr:hypothetical protein [Deltaproteobacteria bacterium]